MYLTNHKETSFKNIPLLNDAHVLFKKWSSNTSLMLVEIEVF